MLGGRIEGGLKSALLFFGEPDGEAHEGGADRQADPVGGFAEDDEGNGDRERDFGVVHRGEGAGADARCAEIPEEEAKAGGDEAEIEEDEELGSFEIDGNVAGEGRGEGDEESTGVEEREDVAVAEGGLLGAETAVEDLAEGEGEVAGWANRRRTEVRPTFFRRARRRGP